jgi:hypothetical protein
MAVQPTPTQEENDLAATGQHVMNKEDDGSGPDPGLSTADVTRHVEAAKPSPGYQTRQATAAPPRAQPAKPKED